MERQIGQKYIPLIWVSHTSISYFAHIDLYPRVHYLTSIDYLTSISHLTCIYQLLDISRPLDIYQLLDINQLLVTSTSRPSTALASSTVDAIIPTLAPTTLSSAMAAVAGGWVEDKDNI